MVGVGQMRFVWVRVSRLHTHQLARCRYTRFDVGASRHASFTCHAGCGRLVTAHGATDTTAAHTWRSESIAQHLIGQCLLSAITHRDLPVLNRAISGFAIRYRAELPQLLRAANGPAEGSGASPLVDEQDYMLQACPVARATAGSKAKGGRKGGRAGGRAGLRTISARECALVGNCWCGR